MSIKWATLAAFSTNHGKWRRGGGRGGVRGSGNRLLRRLRLRIGRRIGNQKRYLWWKEFKIT